MPGIVVEELRGRLRPAQVRADRDVARARPGRRRRRREDGGAARLGRPPATTRPRRPARPMRAQRSTTAFRPIAIALSLKPEEDRAPVELALDVPLLAAVVEAEDLVVEVQAAHDELQAARERVAALRVDLGVGIEERVAVRPARPAVGAVGVLVGPDRGRVVGHRAAQREAPLVVGQVQVELVGRRALQPGRSGSPGRRIERGLRSPCTCSSP